MSCMKMNIGLQSALNVMACNLRKLRHILESDSQQYAIKQVAMKEFIKDGYEKVLCQGWPECPKQENTLNNFVQTSSM